MKPELAALEDQPPPPPADLPPLNHPLFHEGLEVWRADTNHPATVRRAIELIAHRVNEGAAAAASIKGRLRLRMCARSNACNQMRSLLRYHPAAATGESPPSAVDTVEKLGGLTHRSAGGISRRSAPSLGRRCPSSSSYACTQAMSRITLPDARSSGTLATSPISVANRPQNCSGSTRSDRGEQDTNAPCPMRRKKREWHTVETVVSGFRATSSQHSPCRT